MQKSKITQEDRHESMRGYFAYSLYQAMLEDDRIVVITADLGYGMFDFIRRDFPDRFINTGAAEQLALGVAVGLAQEGKIPFVYTITSFYMRAAETLNLYLSKENTPVILIGGGRGRDYRHDGPSHDAVVAQRYIGNILKISSYMPDTNEEAASLVRPLIALASNGLPGFISLRR